MYWAWVLDQSPVGLLDSLYLRNQGGEESPSSERKRGTRACGKGARLAGVAPGV